jgi:hypothetical protein
MAVAVRVAKPFETLYLHVELKIAHERWGWEHEGNDVIEMLGGPHARFVRTHAANTHLPYIFRGSFSDIVQERKTKMLIFNIVIRSM